VVEVDDRDRDRDAVAARGGQVRHQRAAVRQTGYLVVGGVVVSGAQGPAGAPQARQSDGVAGEEPGGGREESESQEH